MKAHPAPRPSALGALASRDFRLFAVDRVSASRGLAMLVSRRTGAE